MNLPDAAGKLRAGTIFREKALNRQIQIIAILATAGGLQSCGTLGTVLLDPSFKSAFIIPAHTTPISEIQRDPNRFSGDYVAVTGTATSVTPGTILIDDYLTITRDAFPGFDAIREGSPVAVRGKFVSNRFSKKGPEIRNAVDDRFRLLFDPPDEGGRLRD